MDTVLQVCCGYYHTLILSHNGLVFGFGRNDYGQLGLGHTQPRVYNCQQIMHLRDKNVLSVTAGCYHSIASTLNGMLYVFGRNNHGQLGTGDLYERHSPHPVDNFIGRRILSVAAGFYHTLVLTVDDVCDSIDDEADVIDTKGLIQRQMIGSTNSESANSKELSVDGPLSKTLPPPLLLTAESKSPKITRSASMMLDRESKNDTSFEIPTRMSIREILIQIVDQLNDTVRRNQTPSVCKCKETNDRWICRVLATVSTLFELIRTYICDAERCVELPFLLDESFSILRTLFQVIESTLKLYKDDLYLGDGTDSSIEDEFQHIFVLPPSRLLTACDIIQEIHAVGNLESKTDMKSTKAQILRKLRQELLFVYLLVPEIIETNAKLATESLVEDCSKCLAKTFPVLYYNSSLRAHFFCALDAHLISIDSLSLGDEWTTILRSADGMSEKRIETVRILRLYTRVSFKYRGNNEVVNLFQSSQKQGLMIFRSLLKVYSHLSVLCLDLRIQQSLCNIMSEFSRAMGILEHCNSNFIKCAIPIIFAASLDSNNIGDNVHDIGLSIISEIFHGAELVFDLMSHHPLSADVLNILRSSTVIPSILPTFLLYSIAYADKSLICREDVLPFAIELIDKIKKFSQLDIPTIDNKNGSAGASDASSINENNMKNSAPWWSKLFKLSVILCSKLASSLILESEKTAFDNPTISVKSLITHEIWKYISGPNLALRSLPSPESKALDITSRVIDISSELRETLTSTSYNFIQQVAKSNGYNNIIDNIENIILDTYYRVDRSIFIIGQKNFYSSLTVNPYYATIWNHIRNFIMQINSIKSEILSF
jgi:hypothetical protein